MKITEKGLDKLFTEMMKQLSICIEKAMKKYGKVECSYALVINYQTERGLKTTMCSNTEPEILETIFEDHIKKLQEEQDTSGMTEH